MTIEMTMYLAKSLLYSLESMKMNSKRATSDDDDDDDDDDDEDDDVN